jgi:kumamolisin
MHSGLPSIGFARPIEISVRPEQDVGWSLRQYLRRAGHGPFHQPRKPRFCRREVSVKRTFVVICSLLSVAFVTLMAQPAAIVPSAPGSHRIGTGRTVTPQSSIQRPEDIGLYARTHFLIYVPAGKVDAEGFSGSEVSGSGTPIAGYYAETPASLACLYKQVTVTTGCNPASLANSQHATGGAKAIAIVDAYHYPNAKADLTAYSAQFGLPAPTTSTFTVTNAGTTPGADPNCATFGGWNCWASEAALDIEMAHAMAPSAHIYLVEALSNSFTDLFAAETKAIALVKAAGGGEVSNSWGGSEFSTETSYDSKFVGANVVIFASTGDQEGTEYPSVSPNVVAVGGTTVSRNPATLNAESENAWEDGGGGFSRYEPRPAYQSSISTLVGSHRGVPDVSAVANPRTGVWVYDSFDTGSTTAAHWNIFGGTSVASPLWAAIVNHAAHFEPSSAAELSLIYASAATTTDFRDVTYGSCGYYEGWFAVKGWDPCTGSGAPVATGGK